MKKIIIHALQIMIILLYRVCSLLPTQNKIMCLSRQTNGSTRDFSLIRSYISEHYPGWRVVCLVKTLDNVVTYAPHMFRQIYHIATAKAVVLDSYCIVVSLLGKRVKAPVLQMWHALGNMKKFGYMTLDTPEGHSSETARLLHMHEGYDSVLVSSNSFAADLAAGFNVSTDILYEAPLPRVDLLVDPTNRDEQREHILSALPQLSNGKKSIVYCPTFRREAAPNEQEAMAALINAIDFSRYNLIFKKHPVSTQRFSDSHVIQDYPSGLDMLYIADYVISDYSTVIYEAGLLEIPTFIYAYDWDTYSGKRSLNIDIRRDVPTLFTTNATELIRAIERGDFDSTAYRSFIRDNITIPEGQTCTQRVVEHIFDMIEHGKTQSP